MAAWLRKDDPGATKRHVEAMKSHLLNDILRYRYQDKQAFAGSQLDTLFKALSEG